MEIVVAFFLILLALYVIGWGLALLGWICMSISNFFFNLRHRLPK